LKNDFLSNQIGLNLCFMKFGFDHSYHQLGSDFSVRVAPTPVSAPKWIALNEALAEELFLDPKRLKIEVGLDIFSGNRLPEDACALAMVYAGHQFGHFVPQLGDGRAILIGEIIDKNQNRKDLQLKGAGLTPFSRQGDGRSPLGPVLREFLLSEAMHALGVPSTRALAAVSTGESVCRDEALPGGILCRVASSHLRVGTFEYFAHQKKWEALERLIAYAVERHFSEYERKTSLAHHLFHHVCQRQSELVASWMSLGFIHGVMNTDNTSISGETIDYGPCAFMEEFKSDQVFSFIDRHGRYAYENQPAIAMWNMQCLGEALFKFLSTDEKRAKEIVRKELEFFEEHFLRQWWFKMSQKFGFFSFDEKIRSLILNFLKEMERSRLDFTQSFRYLVEFNPEARGFVDLSDKISDEWLNSWWALLTTQKETQQQSFDLMKRVNPIYIPRNHLVEAVIQEAQSQQSLVGFHKLWEALKTPFQRQEGLKQYETPAPPGEKVCQTFCGT